MTITINDENKKRATRAELVHPKFIERWARRYLHLSATRGKDVAVVWANNFLNPEDAPRLAAAVRNIKEGKPVA